MPSSLPSPERPGRRPLRVFCVACGAIVLLVLIAVVVAWRILPPAALS